MTTSDWIEHDGKGPPALEPQTLVTFRCRDGYEDLEPAPFEGLSGSETGGEWGRCWWTHNGRDNDVVAYQVVTE